jgi:hypothetical protein
MVSRLVPDVFLDAVEKCEFFLGCRKRNAWRDGCRKRWEKGGRNGRSLRRFGVMDFGPL